MATHERHVNCPSSLCTRIAMEFNNKELSDVKLIVGEKEFYAHRMILASQSEMFRIMFMGSQWLESTQAEITLTESKKSESVFHDFLSFFYSAKIHLTEESIVAVRMLADKYQHIQLEKECDRFISQIIIQDDTDTIVGWLISMANLGEKLEQRCLNKLQMEFIKLMTSETSRGLLTLDLLMKIVDSSNVLVRNELMLFNLVAGWIMEKRHSSSQKSAISKLLPLIRFSCMTIEELGEVENSPLGLKYQDMIIRVMFEAYKSRAVNACLKEKLESEEDTSESILPRMYTDAPWGAGYTKDSETFLSNEFDFLNFKCPVIDRAIKPCLIKNMTDTWTVSYKKEIKSYMETEDQVVNRKLVTHDLTFKFKFGERLRNYEIVIITGYTPKEQSGDEPATFQMLTTKKHYGAIKPIKLITTKTQSRRKIRLTEILKPAILSGSEYVMSLGVYVHE